MEQRTTEHEPATSLQVERPAPPPPRLEDRGPPLLPKPLRASPPPSRCAAELRGWLWPVGCAERGWAPSGRVLKSRGTDSGSLLPCSPGAQVPAQTAAAPRPPAHTGLCKRSGYTAEEPKSAFPAARPLCPHQHGAQRGGEAHPQNPQIWRWQQQWRHHMAGSAGPSTSLEPQGQVKLASRGQPQVTESEHRPARAQPTSSSHPAVHLGAGSSEGRAVVSKHRLEHRHLETLVADGRQQTPGGPPREGGPWDSWLTADGWHVAF